MSWTDMLFTHSAVIGSLREESADCLDDAAEESARRLSAYRLTLCRIPVPRRPQERPGVPRERSLLCVHATSGRSGHRA